MNVPGAFDLAQAGYDDGHEQALVEAIITAISNASLISEPPVLCLRTGEITSALAKVLASTIAMSPSRVRSPAEIRKTCETIRRKVTALVRDAERDPVFADLLARCFRDDDHERAGHA
jgi:hypothetical protein